MDDQEEQDDELLALESIYDETVLSTIKDTDDKGGQFTACPHLPEKFYIQSEPLNKGNVESGLHKIQHLPPIVIHFQLPTNYPSIAPPHFTLTCKWLTHNQLSSLCQRLDELWEENKGMVILFTWINFLQEELFDFLQLSSPLDIRNIVISHNSSKNEENNLFDSRCIQDIVSQDLLLMAILDYNKQMKADIFERSMFLCSVCFIEKQGTNCICFMDCDHVFCKECMRDYFVIQISDGNVQNLICPHDKCQSEAHPSQVKALVPDDIYKRYDDLLLKSSLDTMMDIMYCPRRLCQCPVLLDRENNIGRCPSCQFVFCHLCKLVYHGLSPCRIKAAELNKLKEEYENADDEGKKFLEKKYGRRIIHQAIEESITREWLDNYTKPCPACGTSIQKIDGCNKMTCMKCRNYFCWLCGDSLSRSNPYSHFNMDGPCRNQLFQGMGEEEFDFEGDEFGEFEL
ncbi:hypothetical protein SNE40_016838 [Patella caerulea]|uniref:RBR-type E3 ubiquitin transferase n=1 Tax=Patella caerulea TaxID=87958 RepID=A0AAN8J992_PATCE